MTKKIKTWEPDDFQLEMTTHGLFPKEESGQHTMRNGKEISHRIFPATSFFVIRRKMI